MTRARTLILDGTALYSTDPAIGWPAAQDELPGSAAFAATLLILREFMHHLQFSSITVKA